MYVAQVRSGAVDEKSSGRPGAAVEGIHDFVELQGCAETVGVAKAATSRSRCDYCSPGSIDVRRMEGEAPPGSPATQKKDYESTVAGFWCHHKMPVRASIMFPLFGPNSTAPAPSPFPMRWSGYSR